MDLTSRLVILRNLVHSATCYFTFLRSPLFIPLYPTSAVRTKEVTRKICLTKTISTKLSVEILSQLLNIRVPGGYCCELKIRGKGLP